jgi:hypothetical protein
LLIFFNAPFSGTAPVFCFPVYGKMRFVVNDEIRPGAGIPAGILKFLQKRRLPVAQKPENPRHCSL